jgi:catechol 2,3-dioxygenase-like lactoylglutathione lyase family enzyme
VSMLQLDSVRIATPDLEAALAAYQVLLGTAPVPHGGAHRFQLGRGAVELEAGEGALRAVRFTAEDAPPLPPGFHGIDVRVEPPDDPRPTASASPVVAIDHVVVHTPDPERAVALWRDAMGLRLALDRVFAERGLRLLFFRSGGITLEYASPQPAPAEHDGVDRLYGLSYRLAGGKAELEAHRQRLLQAGFDVSEVRRGMRRGTSVAAVRSRTAGVPTLLLVEDEPPAAPAA